MFTKRLLSVVIQTAAMQFPNVTLHNNVTEWHQMPNGTWVPWTALD
jgi:hypothetical protein